MTAPSQEASLQLLGRILDAFPALAANRGSDIADGLRSISVRIVADRENLASPNGQTALVTLVCQCVMLGVRLDVDIPDVPQLIPQPPLRADLPLLSALVEWAGALFPGCLVPGESPLVTFAIGDTAMFDAIHVAGSDNLAVLDNEQGRLERWAGNAPYGAIAAAAAGAAEVARAVIPRLVAQLHQPRRIEAHPMGLYGPDPLQVLPQVHNPRCPVCGTKASAA